MSELDSDFDRAEQCQSCGEMVQEVGAPYCDDCDANHPQYSHEPANAASHRKQSEAGDKTQ